MIDIETQLQWLDVDSATVTSGNVGQLFGRYIHRGMVQDNNMVINFDLNNGAVLIPDWKGWTRLIRLTRVPTSDKCDGGPKWIKLTTSLGKSIVGTEDTFVPLYNQTKVSSGFHGESKYFYELLVLGDIAFDPGDIIGDRKCTVRVRRCIDPVTDSSVDFDMVASAEYVNNKTSVGYDILTASEFYNANDIYLWNNQ